jgi:hypothetical protein
MPRRPRSGREGRRELRKRLLLHCRDGLASHQGTLPLLERARLDLGIPGLEVQPSIQQPLRWSVDADFLLWVWRHSCSRNRESVVPPPELEVATALVEQLAAKKPTTITLVGPSDLVNESEPDASEGVPSIPSEIPGSPEMPRPAPIDDSPVPTEMGRPEEDFTFSSVVDYFYGRTTGSGEMRVEPVPAQRSASVDFGPTGRISPASPEPEVDEFSALFDRVHRWASDEVSRRKGWSQEGGSPRAS